MGTIEYTWNADSIECAFELTFVKGTGGSPFLFGEAPATRAIEVRDFYISKFPVTQAFWTHIVGGGSNPARRRGDRRPVENVSWWDVTRRDGFVSKLNAGRVLAALGGQLPGNARATFRLPSEREWEYAARGGEHWRDGFQFSGGDDIDQVAWYRQDSGNETHDVGQKRGNQLGIHDICGNVWEWCQDSFARDVSNVPTDGSAFAGESPDRVLRGGCHHNWAVHCTVSKRYEIAPEYHDECIGFRLVLGVG